MPFDTIFTVKKEDLGALGANDAIRFMAELLWSEARRIGVSVAAVNISSRINVPDGGVDATVTAEPQAASQLLEKGRTAFQVKAGDFKPTKAAIEKELFGKNAASKDSLGPKVRDCMDAGGKYTLICIGNDFIDAERDEAAKHLRQAFVDCDYVDPRVDVLSQNQLIGLLKPFPSLCLALNGRGGIQFQTIKAWSDEDQMRADFKAGPEQENRIEQIRSELRKLTEAVHVRILGEAGVGKTRLALQAVGAEDLAPFVLYCDRPSICIEGGLLTEIARDDNDFALVLVVDECDFDSRSTLWNKLKHKGPRIRLLTIYNEFEQTSGNIIPIEIPALPDQQIVAILKEYLPPSEPVDRWVPFCGGSPRMAHLLGSNLKNNPDDPLNPGDTVSAWNRIIAGPDSVKSPDVEERIRVLRHIALFKRFGFRAYVAEAQFIAELSKVTWQRFQEIVKVLRGRRLLQGEATLYLTPGLLHIKLWTDWWETYGPGLDVTSFEASLPPQLKEWFHEMFQYAAESRVAKKVVEELLGKGGPFTEKYFFEQGRDDDRFFLALTSAAPEAALLCLQRTVGTWDVEKLRLFGPGRREVVWALEKIAVWRELFAGAARLLLNLAEAENENVGNNATGVFAELFMPAQAPVAPTEASPEERFPVLKEALEHHSRHRRKVALKACDDALQTGHFSRMIGAEYQGLRRQPDLWMPKTWGEIFDAYRRVWHLLKERLDLMPEDERDQALTVILSNARGLTAMANLTKMVTDTLRELADKPYVDKRKIIEVVESVLHYDGKGYEPERREPWEELQKLLITEDFHSQIRRYVGMDLIEDKFNDAGQHADKAQPKIESLADEAIKNPEILKPELAWLVTDQAKQGYNFGYNLGLRDKGFSLLPVLLEAQRNATKDSSVFFFGGYLRALRETSEEAWETLLDLATEDSVLRTHVPELTWRSGLTDRAGVRILNLAKAGVVPPHVFRIFSYGGVIRQLPAPRFEEWIEFLLSEGSRPAAFAALDLCHFYYRMGEPRIPLPRELIFNVLTAPPLFMKGEERRNAVSQDYEWSEIGTAYIEQHPDKAVALGSVMLQHFRENGTIVGAFHSQTDKVLNEVLRRFPDEMWKQIASYLGLPIDSRAFHIYHWLREGSAALLPSEAVWNWVNEDVEKRAWYVAQFVQPVFPGNEHSVSAREVLVRFGDRKDVRNNLIANFSTETWWGPESSHAQGKLDQLQLWKKDESNPNVVLWLDEYTASIQNRIERARIEEERGF